MTDSAVVVLKSIGGNFQMFGIATFIMDWEEDNTR